MKHTIEFAIIPCQNAISIQVFPCFGRDLIPSGFARHAKTKDRLRQTEPVQRAAAETA
jgi:hypothetical protein